jgi:hypothetical protein
MKTAVSDIRAPLSLSRQGQQIVRILGSLEATLLPPTVIHASAEMRIHAQHSAEHRCLTCVADPTTAPSVRPVERGAKGEAEFSEGGQRKQRIREMTIFS